MHILHVIASLDPADGGPSAVVPRLAAAQAALGDRVTLVSYAPPPDAAAATAQALAGIPGLDRCDLRQVPPPGVAERFSGSVLAAAVGLAVGDGAATVCHLHGVWEGCLRASAAVLRRRGVPYCVVPHGMLDPWSLSQRRWKKELALAAGYRRMLTGAAFLHTLNRDEAALLRPLGLGRPAEVIPNGVCLEELTPLPPPRDFRRRHPALAERDIVLFLGRLHYKKGLDLLAESFVRLARRRRDPVLVVAGPDAGAQTDLVQRVTAAGLKDRVLLTGPLYGRDKLEALAAAACFCLPSRQEGFSIAITEALACGLPTVVSEPCHFPEVAEAGAGHVVPLTVPALADALGQVIDAPPAARARMAEAGRRLVAERFTWTRVAEHLRGVYRRTLTAAAA